MGAATKIFLVDESAQRRAQISYGLRNSALHVEPFGSYQDVLDHGGHPSPNTFVLIHDTCSEMADFVDAMRDGKWFAHIGYAVEPKTADIVAALNGGAIGYLELPFEAEDLGAVIVNGADRSARQYRAADARNRIGGLTGRERDVLGGITEGLSNRDIAEKLEISARTVEIHRANLLRKIGAKHTLKAIRMAIDADYF